MALEKYHILFVEDETNIGETLTERLQEDYATVVWAATKNAADASSLISIPEVLIPKSSTSLVTLVTITMFR